MHFKLPLYFFRKNMHKFSMNYVMEFLNLCDLQTLKYHSLIKYIGKMLMIWLIDSKVSARRNKISKYYN